MTAALEGGEWSAARPDLTLRPGKTRYPFYRRLGAPQGRSRRAENLVPTGIRSRTVQPVVSRYTDWATRPCIYIYIYVHIHSIYSIYLLRVCLFAFEDIRLFSCNTLKTKSAISSNALPSSLFVSFTSVGGQEMRTVIFRIFEEMCLFPAAYSV